MCYYLYGAVNEGVNAADYKKAAGDTRFRFNCGDAATVNECVRACGRDYRLTADHCDCDTAVGGGHTNKKELKELAELLIALKEVRGIKYVLISKNWVENTNNSEETVHIDDIDPLHLLASIEEDRLYRIELYKKNY